MKRPKGTSTVPLKVPLSKVWVQLDGIADPGMKVMKERWVVVDALTAVENIYLRA